MLDYVEALANSNALAVFVAAAASFASGALWYSPGVLAKPWMKEIGWTDKDVAKARQDGKQMGLCFIAQLVLSFGFSILLNLLGTSGLWNGVALGLFVAIMFTGTTMLVHNLFERVTMKLFAINVGYNLLMGIIIGGILGVWPR